MTIPRLLHPVPCTIVPIAKSTTPRDRSAREPIQAPTRGDEYTIQAQVKWTRSTDLRKGEVGPYEGARGYILVRSRDLAAGSITVSTNDKITRIGRETTEVYVMGTEPMAHYSDQGGATLLRIWFTDQKPQKGRA